MVFVLICELGGLCVENNFNAEDAGKRRAYLRLNAIANADAIYIKLKSFATVHFCRLIPAVTK
jgi:hypothetical protein